MRIPKENGLQVLQDLYCEDFPTEFQLALTLLDATELMQNSEGIIGLAVARYSASLSRGGHALVTVVLEDLAERSDVQEWVERLSKVDGEYSHVGEVRKLDMIQFASGGTKSEITEVSSTLAKLLQHMAETILVQEEQFLALPTVVQTALCSSYGINQSQAIRNFEFEGVRWFRFDDPMSWSAW